MKRLAIVTMAAVAGFAAALIRFGQVDSSQSCLLDAPKDPSYAVQFADTVTMDQTNHVITVRHAGQPVSGARVCMNTWMLGMTGMAMTTNGSELSPGRYNIPFQFAMGGPWKATVIVSEKAGQQVGVPITFMVNVGAMPGS